MKQINNAGFLPQPELLKTVDLKEWWEGFEVNVLGPALVIQTYLRTKAPEREGVVVALNTIAAHWGSVLELSAYAVSKAASLRMIELFQVESFEVCFVSIHPCAVGDGYGREVRLKRNTPH